MWFFEKPVEPARPHAVWLDRGTIVTACNRGQMEALFDKLKECGFAVVYFECNNAGYVLYESDFAEASPLLGGKNALREAIEAARRRNMQLHLWYWVFAVGNTKYNELVRCAVDFEGPVLRKVGLHNALRTANGSLLLRQQTEFWLSPASAEARSYITGLIIDGITHYAVDGVHLDYIRFPFQHDGMEMGFDAESSRAFHQATGVSLKDGKLSTDDRNLWIDWKTELVSSFVEQLSTVVRTAQPHLKISAAVFAIQQEKRLPAIQQDWEKWIKRAWIDVLNPMTYDAQTAQFENSLKVVVEGSASLSTNVWPGLCINRLDARRFDTHLRTMARNGFGSATIFAAAHINKQTMSWFS